MLAATRRPSSALMQRGDCCVPLHLWGSPRCFPSQPGTLDPGLHPCSLHVLGLAAGDAHVQDEALTAPPPGLGAQD